MASSSDSTQQVLDTSIRLGLIFLLAYACYLIFRPFLMPVAWGLIIAVALLPVLRSLETRVGAKAALGGVILIGLGVLIVPTIMLGASMVEAVQNGYAAFEAGSLRVPPPPEGVAEWPVIGERAFDECLEEVFQTFPDLRSKTHLRAGNLSGGESRMVACGRALMQDPKVLLLDEPTAGLSPLYVEQFFETIEAIHRTRGVAVLLTEQNAAKALGIADRVMVLSLGEGSEPVDAAEMTKDRLKEAYKL